MSQNTRLLGAGVSEETEGQDPGTEAVGGGGAGVDPAAVAIALGGASREEADAFLREQRALAADQRTMIADQRKLVQLQAKELSHELSLRHWSLWVRHASGLLKLALELSAGLLLLALVTGIGLIVWNAANADGLVIESFSVPPDLASKGISGQVVASQLLDKLTVIQNLSTSVRPTKSYANSWGDELKVEIPDTGVSVGEVYRFLRGRLGHEVHVSGEVTRAVGGIAITTRVGGDGGATFTGPESDLDALVRKSAEQVFRVIQPDRYARYLFYPRPGAAPRYDEARAVLDQEIAESGPTERSWAWAGLGVLANVQGNYKEAVSDYRKAIAENPDSAIPYSNLASAETELSHPEAAKSAASTVVRMLDQGARPDIISTYAARIQVQNRFLVAFCTGDYLAAAGLAKNGVDLPLPRNTANHEFFEDNAGYVLSLLHDGAAVRAWWNGLETPDRPSDKLHREITRLQIAGGMQDWRAVVDSAAQVELQASALHSIAFFADISVETQLHPVVALAKARLGDPGGAQGLIATTPVDCYDCIRTRGLIAAAAQQWGRADYWFARAINDAPSIPMAYADWGQALLARGQLDAAIAKFRLASQKSPHFADPLEGWGEALMAKNQSHLALAKFAEAEKCAPNWGRLHLKWGEALFYAGKSEDAKKQFAMAAGLDLVATDRTELARMTAAHG